MTAKSRSLATLALGAALLGGCAAVRVPADGNGLTPYPLTKSLRAGDIIHLPTGTAMNFEQAMEMIAAAKVIYIGEMHTNFQAHEAQRRVIEELERRFPGKVAIGMEMFRVPQQPALDRWTRGELTELEFLKESKWYDNWGSDFGLYRGILTFARERRLDVLALNPAKDVQKQFAAAGAGTLPPELAGKVPETDFTDPFQRALLEAVFKGHSAGKKAPAATKPDDTLGQMVAQARAPEKDALARMAKCVKDQPELKLTIAGHADERGSTEFNLALGERRAITVRRYLETLGVPPDRLRTLSYGEERALMDAHDEAAWEKNRRVEFKILQTEAGPTGVEVACPAGSALKPR